LQDGADLPLSDLAQELLLAITDIREGDADNDPAVIAIASLLNARIRSDSGVRLEAALKLCIEKRGRNAKEGKKRAESASSAD
jgi:hypothetical protein